MNREEVIKELAGMFLLVILAEPVFPTGRGSLYLISSPEVYLQKSKCEVNPWVAGNVMSFTV